MIRCRPSRRAGPSHAKLECSKCSFGSVEAHLDPTVPAVAPLAEMELGLPRGRVCRECRVPSRHNSARRSTAGRGGTRPSQGLCLPGVSSFISTQQCPPQRRWPRWNSAFPGVVFAGRVEFHLDPTVPAVAPLAEVELGLPRGCVCRECRVPSRHNSVRRSTAGRGGTRPSQGWCLPGVSSSISTQQCPPQRRWPRWNSAFPGVVFTGSVEFHLDTTAPAAAPLVGVKLGLPGAR